MTDTLPSQLVSKVSCLNGWACWPWEVWQPHAMLCSLFTCGCSLSRMRLVELLYLTAIGPQGIHGLLNGRVGRLTQFHLGLHVVVVVRTHHEKVLSPFVNCDFRFGLDYSVNSSNCRKIWMNKYMTDASLTFRIFQQCEEQGSFQASSQLEERISDYDNPLEKQDIYK